MNGNIIISNIASLTIGDDDDDRISDVPDFIAHHILLYLLKFPKELIRMSLLSKKWLSITASFPILDFDFEDFIRAKYPLPGVHCDPKYAKDMFLKYVEYSTSRFSKQKNFVSANRFSLVGDLQDPADASIIDRCLGPTLKQGLQSFGIFDSAVYLCDGQQPPPMYRLPDKLLSVPSLTCLRIYCCQLPSSLMLDDDVVRFKSLKELYLTGLYLNEEMIKRLTSACPLLEVFKVQSCYGIKSIRVYGLHNLQRVGISSYTHKLKEIDIQAPNLSHIYLLDCGARTAPLCINLFSYKKLSLVYCGYISKQFVVSLPNFPFLETLTLMLPFKYNYKNLKLSSNFLKNLFLGTQTYLDEIKIDTPNLLYFWYSSRYLEVTPPIRNSSVAKACVECYPDFDADGSWLQKFRRFLDMTVRFNVLKLHIYGKFIDVEELKLLESSPFELEHIHLYVNTAREWSEYVPVVDAVLWCCRPRSLTLISDFSFDDLKERDHIVKDVIVEKLLEQEDDGQTNVQIVFSTVKAFRSNHMFITFSKEEVSQEAG